SPSTIRRTGSRRTAAIPRLNTSARSRDTDRRRSTGARGSSWSTASGAGFRASTASRACSPARPVPDAVWDTLSRHAAAMRARTVRELFAEERDRDRMRVEAAGWYLDYAKHRVTAETMRLLVDLAGVRGLRERIDAMFRGEHIN